MHFKKRTTLTARTSQKTKKYNSRNIGYTAKKTAVFSAQMVAKTLRCRQVGSDEKRSGEQKDENQIYNRRVDFRALKNAFFKHAAPPLRWGKMIRFGRKMTEHDQTKTENDRKNIPFFLVASAEIGIKN